MFVVVIVLCLHITTSRKSRQPGHISDVVYFKKFLNLLSFLVLGILSRSNQSFPLQNYCGHTGTLLQILQHDSVFKIGSDVSLKIKFLFMLLICFYQFSIDELIYLHVRL